MSNGTFYSDPCAATTLVVLAGGEGKRMGFAKSHLILEGKPVLERLISRLEWPGPTMLVTAPGRAHAPGWEHFDAAVVDAVSGEGPMRAISTALQQTKTEYAVMIPVDMPNIGRSQLRWMIERLSARPDMAALMIENAQLEPLPLALRTAAAKSLIDARLSTGKLALRLLVEDFKMLIVQQPADWPVEVWMNLNVPGDLAKFHAEFEECHETANTR